MISKVLRPPVGNLFLDTVFMSSREVIIATITMAKMIYSIFCFHLIIKKLYFVTKIILTYCEKQCSNDQEKFWKFEAEGREFTKILRSLGQFIQTMKGQYNFLLVSGGFSDLIR